MTDFRDKVISGSLIRSVFHLAIPVAIGMFTEVMLQVVNFFWVGKLGSHAQDAITTSMIVIWTVMATLSLITFGLASPLAQAIGAGEKRRAEQVFFNALMLSLIIGLIAGGAIFFLVDEILLVVGASAESIVHARPYLLIHAFIIPLLTVLETGYSGLRAAGNTRFPAMLGISMVVLNAVLDPLFIFGFGPIPAMGTAGAAIATGISFAAALLVTIVHVRKSNAAVRFVAELKQLDTRVQCEIMRIGLPIMSQWLTFTGVYWFLIGVVHKFGSDAGAAMGIGNRMESISYTTCTAFAIAASTIVGQNLGANQKERASKGAWAAVGLGLLVTSVMTLLFLVFPREIASIFSSDPEVIDMARRYLIILGLSQVTMSLEIILEGAFSGAGDTLPPMIVMLPGAVIRIPLAIWLSDPSRLGIDGVWWSLTITTTIKGVLLAIWFSRNRWQSKYRPLSS